MVRWETVGLNVGHIGVLLDLLCDVHNTRLHSEGLKFTYFELADDVPKCYVLAVF